MIMCQRDCLAFADEGRGFRGTEGGKFAAQVGIVEGATVVVAVWTVLLFVPDGGLGSV